MRRAALIFSIAVLASCGQKVANAPQLAAKPPQVTQAPATVSGKVQETMNAGGYTYLRIATAGGDVWAAIRESKVTKGAVVTVSPQMVAENFESSTLHRKFDRLVMGALVDAGAETSPVEKAGGGITVAEAWSGKNQLKDKPVLIRGKVVKFLPNIMGKNWLHVRDGSGSPGTDDITVTTRDVAKVGDVIVVSGTLHVDKDFGAGYVYPVIVEDARLGQ